MVEKIDVKRFNNAVLLYYYHEEGYNEYILSSKHNNVKVVVRGVRGYPGYFAEIVVETLTRERSGWKLYKVHSKYFINNDRARKTYEKLMEIFDNLPPR